MKAIFRLVGKECLYLFLVFCVAVLGNFIQFQRRVNISEQDRPSYAGVLYQYNYIMYALGFVLFIVAIFALNKALLKKDMEMLKEYSIIPGIVVGIIPIVFSGLMLITNVFTGFCILGFDDEIKPDILLELTIIGWPVINALFVWAMIIKSSLKRNN